MKNKNKYKPNEVVAGIFDGTEKKVSDLTVGELRTTLCEAFCLLDKVDNADIEDISVVVKEIRNWMSI